MAGRRFGIVGAGRMGGGLALALTRRGWPLVGASSRSAGSARRLVDLCRQGEVFDDPKELADRLELLFLTVPDDAIATAAEAVAPAAHPGTVVLHTSGSKSSEILRPVKKSGASAGSLHPLQTAADPETAADLLPGSWFAVEGDPAAVAAAVEVVRALDGKQFLLPPGTKPLYHAAGVMASNYVVAAFAAGVSCLKEIGIPGNEAVSALLPLLKGAAANLESLGLPAAMTGPLTRGDTETIRDHLAALSDQLPQLQSFYSAAGLVALEQAAAQNRLSPETIEALKNILEGDVP